MSTYLYVAYVYPRLPVCCLCLPTSTCMLPMSTHVYLYVAYVYPRLPVCCLCLPMSTCMLPMSTHVYLYVAYVYPCLPVCCLCLPVCCLCLPIYELRNMIGVLHHIRYFLICAITHNFALRENYVTRKFPRIQ